MRDITFQQPQAIWIMLVVFLIIFLQLFLQRDRTKRLQAYTSPQLLPYLIVERSKFLNLLKRIAWAALWVLACFALMGPQGNIRYLPTGQSTKQLNQSEQTHEVIFLVDTSGSMSVPDGSHGQTRLEEAKEIMQDTVSQLQGVSLAVYAFTSDLTPVVPPTLDYLFTRIMLRELHINEGDIGGTLFIPVMEKLKSKVLFDPLAYAYTIILLSDGEDNDLYNGKPSFQKKMQSILDAMPSSETFPLKFYTIGLGQLKPSAIPKVTTEEGKPVASKLEPELLKKIAEQGKGEYYAASEWNNWELASTIAKEVKKTAVQRNTETQSSRKVMSVSQEEKIADQYFQIPLGLAILLLLAGCYVLEARN